MVYLKTEYLVNLDGKSEVFRRTTISLDYLVSQSGRVVSTFTRSWKLLTTKDGYVILRISGKNRKVLVSDLVSSSWKNPLNKSNPANYTFN